MAGNVAGLVGELLADEFLGSARAGPVASDPDCAWADAKCRSPGTNTAVKAS
jgi:hypothetical protein